MTLGKYVIKAILGLIAMYLGMEMGEVFAVMFLMMMKGIGNPYINIDLETIGDSLNGLSVEGFPVTLLVYMGLMVGTVQIISHNESIWVVVKSTFLGATLLAAVIFLTAGVVAGI